MAPSAQPQLVPDLFGSTDQGSPSTLFLPFANLVNAAKHQIELSSGRGQKRHTGFKMPCSICPGWYPPLLGQMCACAPRAGRDRPAAFQLLPDTPNSTQLGREDQGGGRRVGGSDTTITHTIHQAPKTPPSHKNPSPLKTTHCPRT